MRIFKAVRLLQLALLLLLCAAVGLSQTEAEGNLRVVPSQLKLRAEGVRFAGREVKSSLFVDGPKLVYDGKAYYYSGSERGGLVAEDLKTGARLIYEPTEIATAAGWLKQRAKESEDETPLRNHLRGYERTGDSIWMGTDGFGVLVFDTKRKVWARYDSEAEARPGKEMSSVFYADDEYVFCGGFNVYSLKHKRWIKVDGIPTRYVRRFGYSGPYVQMPWSLKRYEGEKYLPIGAPYMPFGLRWPDKSTLREDGEAYIFEFGQEESLTQFIIEKWQLEWAFSQAELNDAPQQQQSLK